MEQRTWRWTDAHFFSLPSQTSIYGCTKILNNINGTNKLLVSSLVGRFFTVEYQRIFDKLTPTTKEVQFTYIPGESEIVSVDAANKYRHDTNLTIGITFWKLEENECKQFLHTYSAAQHGEEFNMENVAQGCQSLELSFMPFHLTHTDLVVGNYMESVFLLSGSDSKIHVYREVGYRHSYKEANCEEFFPEFKDIPSIVIWLDILYYYDNKRRITVTGHQDGVLKVSIVDVTKREILQSFSVEFDNPITYVETFSLYNKVSRPSFLPQSEDKEDDEDDFMPVLNILVLSALIPATVYRDVLHNGLRDPLFLPDSNKFDAVLTGCIIDIDFDGENEILIGTYGQEVLAYKLKAPVSTLVHSYSVPETDSCMMSASIDSKLRHRSGDGDLSTTPRLESHASRRVKSQENLSSSVSSETDYIPLSSSKDTVILNNHSSGGGRNNVASASYQLIWQRSFACPVMGINRLDIMGDGMEDLVIVTLKGLHILQPDLNEVAKVCVERLRLLADKVSSDDRDDVNCDKNTSDESKINDKNKTLTFVDDVSSQDIPNNVTQSET